MGNIGYTQNLLAVTEAFEASKELEDLGARFVVAGDGEAGPEVRAAIRTDRVKITGVLGPPALARELSRATVAVVSQRYEGIDFNVPSKLMNFMGQGIPTVASVRPDSEVARIIETSGGGWVTDCSDTHRLSAELAEVLAKPELLWSRGQAGRSFAQEHFTPANIAKQFEQVLEELVELRAKPASH